MADIVTRFERIQNLIVAGKIPETTDDFLSAKGAAAFFKVTLPTLYTKVCKGEITSYKQGNLLCYSRAELYEWIEIGKKTTVEHVEKSVFIMANTMNKNSRFLFKIGF